MNSQQQADVRERTKKNGSSPQLGERCNMVWNSIMNHPMIASNNTRKSSHALALFLCLLLLLRIVFLPGGGGRESDIASRNPVSLEQATNYYPLDAGFCARLPRDLSTSFLWNNQAAVSVQRDAELRTTQLRQGVGRHPLEWNRVLTAIHQEQTLRIWVLANPLDTNTKESWLGLLQKECSRYLGGKVEWTILSAPFATTDYYTNILRTAVDPPPDVILHALSRHEMQTTNWDLHSPDTVQWEEERRFILQNFVRAIRTQWWCKQEPAILFLDDYIPTDDDSSASLWVHEVNSRMLHQVSDYYDVGLISYAQVVRRLVYAESGTSIFAAKEGKYFSDLGHKAILSSILYSVLDYTVVACNDQSQPPTDSTSALVKEDVMRRVNNVVPPFLDGKQSLLTISQEWMNQEERMKQTCPSGPRQSAKAKSACLSYYWAGGTETSQLGRVNKQEGIRKLSDGRLRVTAPTAKLHWRVPLQSSATGDLRAQLFLALLEKRQFQDAPVRVQLTVTNDEHSSTERVFEIPTIVGVGTSIPLTLDLPSRTENDLEFKLDLLNGVGIDIAGFFLCDKVP